MRTEVMEQPIDGGELDLEGFAAIIVGEEHKELLEALGAQLSSSLMLADQLRDSFTTYRDWVVANRGLSSDGMCREVALGSRDLDTFRADMLCYRSQLEQINKIPDVQWVLKGRGAAGQGGCGGAGK
ncbi:uncharacterized protein HaLaN_15386, partial [Haematococcus lacustris]